MFDDVFDECVDSCKENGAFGPTTMGCCPNVDLMAQKALWNVSWRCARCVVVCAMREVTSVEEGQDVEQVTAMRQCAESQLGASCWKTANGERDSMRSEGW